MVLSNLTGVSHMTEHTTKRQGLLRDSTRKPKSLTSLVAAVGASAIGLLGMLPSASANTNATVPEIAVSESTHQSKTARAKLRLNRVGSEIQLAGGGNEAERSP